MPRQKRQWAFQCNSNGQHTNLLPECEYSAREILYDVQEALQGKSGSNRRVQQRQRMRDYRHALVMEAKFLSQEVHQLEKQLLVLKSRNSIHQVSILPWQDVSCALEEDRNRTTIENKELKRHINRQREICQIMKTWVLQNSSLLQQRNSLNQKLKSTWHHVHLLAEEETRQLGYEWITMQMFHQTQHIMDLCSFPPGENSMLDIQIHEQESGGYCIIQQHQAIFESSLAIASELFHELYLKQKIGQGIVQDLDTHFSNKNGRYSRQNSEGNHFIHFIRRQFYLKELNKFIIVGRNILGDDKYPVGKYIRNGLAWIVVKEINPNQLLYQNYLMLEQLHTKNGKYLSLEEDATNRSITLSKSNNLNTRWKQFKNDLILQSTKQVKNIENYLRHNMKENNSIR